jgi:uncharacterized protein with ParB-like and HNH nuclease domain
MTRPGTNPLIPAPAVDTFNPEKKTIGELLSSTNPPILVPDFQRDFSWELEQITYFWADLQGFQATYPTKEAMTGKEYFLGSAVLVNNGDSSLLLDGQQRLATATILLAAIRDKVRVFKQDAAKQFHEQFIVFKDAVDDTTQPKLTLNSFDRDYFHETVQQYPYTQKTPQTRSQQLIANAYAFFQACTEDLWKAAGTNEKAFEQLANLVRTLTRHVSIITVVSYNEDYAASIFETLNDRGVSLSSTDLLRSYVLQKTGGAVRASVLERWREVFENCGANEEAERLIRISWTSEHGDVKVRSVSKIVKESIAQGKTTPQEYSTRLANDSRIYANLKKGEFEDGALTEQYDEVADLGLRVAYPLLMSSIRKSPAEFSTVLRASASVIVRHDIVCGKDRSALESAFFESARVLASEGDVAKTVGILRAVSPTAFEFESAFAKLSFSSRQHPIAKCILEHFERSLAGTDEKKVASARRVHIDHIYPQKPEGAARHDNHDAIVNLLGNLTLLDKRLNETERNALFGTKKAAYEKSDLSMNVDLAKAAEWNEAAIRARHAVLGVFAAKMWPESL